jgi:DNA-directed RNA polymerase specialized sigma subunit
MTLFHVANSANVAELEGLVVAAARPPGNKQKPKVGHDLRKKLSQYLKQDAVAQINQAIYPLSQNANDVLSKRITRQKLKAVGQARLARVLGISQPRVSQLTRNGTIKQFIREAGKRDAVLLLLEKTKRL